MRSRTLQYLSVFGLTAALSLWPTALQAESMFAPELLTIDFETQGCGRLRQQAYYRTESHFVNLCLDEANTVHLVVTDNDGLGRDRMTATKQTSAKGVLYQGTAQNGTVYTINNSTFTLQARGQKTIQEAVTYAALTGLADIADVRYRCEPKVDQFRRAYPSLDLATALRLVQFRENHQFVYQCSVAQQNPEPRPMLRAIVTGTVTYRQRIALPPDAVVEVTLQETSRADAPAVILDRQTIPTNGKQVPIPFTLNYNPIAINPQHTYTVSARILVDGQVQWISTSNPAVISEGNPSEVTVIVNPARRSPRSPR